MPELTATYEVEFSNPLLLRMYGVDDYDPSPAPIRVVLKVQDFTVNLELVSSKHPFTKRLDESFWVTGLTHARIFVTRGEPDTAPEIVILDGGGWDCGPRQQYLRERIAAYTEAAQIALERILSFFRYKLGHPLLRSRDILRTQDFANPLWTGPDGELVWNRVDVIVAVGSASRRMYGRFGVVALDRSRIPELQRYIEAPPEPTLPRELLAQARDASSAGDYRRAVLDIAIACEVAVKLAFFGHDSPGAAALEVLAERGRLRLSWSELLKAPSERAFGKTFLAAEQTAYDDLLQMRRCRNRIAHHGRAQFDAGGKWVAVDHTILQRWWDSADRLIGWLEQAELHLGQCNARPPAI